MKRRAPRDAAGMTLVECLVATALLGIAILMAALLFGAGPRATARIDAGREALDALENTIEAVRAGAIPLVSGPVAGPWGFQPQYARDLGVTLTVVPGDIPGVWDVAADASWVVRHTAEHRRLETLVWTP